jgi:hypothetical protein
MSQINIRQETKGAKGRYVATLDGAEAELTFTRVAPNRLSLDHVGVPKELEGRGVGGALVQHAVARAREEGTKLIARCPFAAAQFKRHPEWADVFDPGAGL